jgi:hypothetical protein
MKSGTPEGMTSGAIIIAAVIPDMGALSKLDASDNGMFGNKDKAGITAWADVLKANTSITELNLAKNRINANDIKILAPAISNNGALSSLNLSSNGLGAEAFMGSTELYVEEKLVATAIADWAPTPHRSLPRDRLEVVSASPPLADGVIINAPEVLGKVVMVSRGGCSFVMKAQRLQAAGAIAMVCVNNEEHKPDEVYGMNSDGTENITIPVMMVSFNTGAQIRAMAEMTVTIKKSFSLTDALKNHK